MRSALIVWGGWSGHDPEECAAIYRRWLHEDGFSVRVETDPEVFLEPDDQGPVADRADASTMGKISREAAQQSRQRRSRAASAWAAITARMGDSFRDSPIYQFVIGGQWVAHPGNIIDYTVDVTKPDDPIMQGIPASFPYHSEQYYMHVDPAATRCWRRRRSPASTRAWIEGVVMPVVWKKHYGKGRVFYSSLGHRAAEFEVPKMATILRRGINWAARD